MFQKSINRAVLSLRIETVSPLLIKAGDAGLDPVAPDLACVRTNHAKHGRTVYIPGSSLKGVIRSAVEASLRTLSPVLGTAACNPLDNASCGGQLGPELRRKDGNNRPSTADIHRRHCLACRLFGSTVLKGRASFRDLFPWSPSDPLPAQTTLRKANETETRHGVSINRLTGAVQHGPFDLEVVPVGVSFWGEIALENYQTWQLGLLVASLDDLTAGAVQLGSSKSRGLGFVAASFERILHEQPKSGDDAPKGVGALLPEDERKSYGLLAEGSLPSSEAGDIRGLVRRYTVEGDHVAAWLTAATASLERLEARA